MKKYLTSTLLFLFVVILFTSCEKEITIDLPEEPPKLVVEGWIEQGKGPIVILTKSSPYFDPIDLTAIMSVIVKDAKVFVSDGTVSEELFGVDDPNYFPFFVYKGSTLKGEIGKTYSLSIDYEGKSYSAVTTIQKTAKWDSLWFVLNPDSDSLGIVNGLASEDGSEYNYYRAFTKILNVDNDFVPILGSVWDDKFFNGQSLIAQLYHGITSNIVPPDEDDTRGFGDYKLGDTVYTKLCTIDYPSYKFWKAAETEIFSGGNPFASTTSVPTNITGGALGCWTGYGATYDTVICK